MDMRLSNTQIHDLNLAAALLSAGFKIIGTSRDTNGRFYFIFKRTDKLTHTINEYWSDELTIKARTFADNIKMLKSRIYSGE